MAQFEDCLKDLSVSYSGGDECDLSGECDLSNDECDLTGEESDLSSDECDLSSDECDLNSGTQQLTQSQVLDKENIIIQKSLCLSESSEECFFFVVVFS